MADLKNGETFEMQGSGAKPYTLKNTGGVYSCSCPAWRNQSIAIERRTCKHLRKLRGDEAETARTGGALPQKPVKSSATGDGEESSGPPLLLAESWDNAADLSGWWMSEKLDGVRAYWDGKQFLSRQGNCLSRPGLVCRRAGGGSSRWRTLDRSQEVSANRQHRPPAGQERSLEGSAIYSCSMRPAPLVVSKSEFDFSGESSTSRA